MLNVTVVAVPLPTRGVCLPPAPLTPTPLTAAPPPPPAGAAASAGVAPAGPVAIPAVTGTPAPPAGLPAPSRTWSTGCCPKAAPLVAVGEGWVVIEIGRAHV